MKQNENDIFELDPYYIGYLMMISSLKQSDILGGLHETLYLAKLYLKCSDIIIYKYNNDDNYELFTSNPYLKTDYEILKDILNKRKTQLFTKEYFDLLIEDKFIHNLSTIPIVFNNIKYLIVIVNNDELNNDKVFYDILKKSLTIILKNIETYHKFTELVNQDGLTKLNNRLSYNEKIKEYDETNQHITFMIMDLFRLKYINDNFGHIIGDLYIKEVAKILQRHFPSKRTGNKAKLKKSKNVTGDNLYRIGGDEFVLLSENKTLEQIEEIIKKVLIEIDNINLGVDEDVVIGLNYGISERTHDETISELYHEADSRLSYDKRNMYEKLKINRRR